jgi:hypothetical protein
MDPRNSGARSPAKSVFGWRWRTSLAGALRKRLAGGATRPEGGPGRSSGLFAPLIPGVAHVGSGGRLGDAIVFALGAALAAGLALMAAGPVGYALDAGAVAFGR